MAALDPADVLLELCSDAGLDQEALDDVAFTGSEPVLPRHLRSERRRRPRSVRQRLRRPNSGGCAPGAASA